MKQILLKGFKFFLIGMLVLLVAALACGLILWLEWPWWVGFFVFLGLAGLWIGGLSVKKLLLRRREQHFVNQINDPDQA